MNAGMISTSPANAAQTDVRHPDIERLLEGRLHEPRRVLGRHPVDATDDRVRVLLPNAKRVTLVAPAVELARVPGTALFEWTGPRQQLASLYRVRWQAPDDTWHETYDPYSFPLHIDRADIARFSSGHHYHAHRFLGAHLLAIEGVTGIRFAVWAPNAERVSVVGTFNHWDGRSHPMSVRGDSGIWELFVPELRAGELYKYEVLGRGSRELRLKADPYGAAFENRPATAAVTTAPSTFQWDDAEWMQRKARLPRLAPRFDACGRADLQSAAVGGRFPRLHLSSLHHRGASCFDSLAGGRHLSIARPILVPFVPGRGLAAAFPASPG
jgi:1,4-alpha-glucan branching enzyme